ncbi:AP2/ERF and B3 domain-containing transcription factor [Senna tora]|uniref:AP2/ERF and B3 domain-containing transcription factor n=1 Tax=Senna tora TaxID=362788 RepID=A0A834SZV6_9FABA|nr:AP2/ERF and B3 domain-containing transcription factor [Senna tora]
MSKEGDHEKATSSSNNNANGGWTLQNSDQPGMSLVVSQLTGSNYLSWSLAVKTALEAKDKLGFVDGTIKPPEDAAQFKKWKPVDSMVKSWLTNSLTKELSKSFVFCNTAKELWDCIAERYSVNNGPKFYQIQRQTVSLEQGSESVTGGQIMNLDPLPSVNKAFSMVVRQETQKEVNLAFNNVESSAMLARAGNNRRTDDKKADKNNWYKELKEQKKKAGKRNAAANAVADTPVEYLKDKENIDLAGVLTALQEITKMVKHKAEEHVNFANLGEFAEQVEESTPVDIPRERTVTERREGQQADNDVAAYDEPFNNTESTDNLELDDLQSDIQIEEEMEGNSEAELIQQEEEQQNIHLQEEHKPASLFASTTHSLSKRLKGIVPQQNGNWGAQIYANNHRVWLGTFKTQKEAAMAYDSAAIRLRRAGDSHRNFPWTSINVEEPRQILFRKKLTPSDVGKLNRIVIPKKDATTCFPEVSRRVEEDAEAGVVSEAQMDFFDGTMRCWRFRYCYWRSSQSFVFTRGWSRFVKDKNLEADDVVAFYLCEFKEEEAGGKMLKKFFMIDTFRDQDSSSSSSLIEEQIMEETHHPSSCLLDERKGFKLFGVQIN